jgi:acetolactate synthase-1/2/3 large subunit
MTSVDLLDVNDPVPCLPNTSTAWDEVARGLQRAGVKRVFGLPDDDMHATRALESQGIDILWCSSQRTAVHMAAGAALATGEATVCVLGRGPAVAAAVPGMLEALSSSAPVVVLAAGTATSRLSARAFQDAPLVSMAQPVTKSAVRVPTAEGALFTVTKALTQAVSGVPGPVFVEIPDGLGSLSVPSAEPSIKGSPSTLTALLGSSARTLLLLGGGARSAACTATYLGLADTFDAGVLVTASGRGSFPESNHRYLGLSGLYMMPQTAELVASADLVVVLGSRLEETAVMGLPADVPWIQVNISVEDVDFSKHGLFFELPLQRLQEITAQTKRTIQTSESGWYQDIKSLQTALPSASEVPLSRCAETLKELAGITPCDAVVVHENGLHDIWSYLLPFFPLADGTRVVVPSEQTTLGFGVAAAAGIAADSGKLVVCIGGDGAFDSFTPDLSFLTRHSLSLVYVIFDDGGFGWLDRQAREEGAQIRFVEAGQSALARINLDDERVLLRTVAPTDDIGAALRGAFERARQHKVTILRVICTADDIPPVLQGHEAAVS